MLEGKRDVLLFYFFTDIFGYAQRDRIQLNK